MVEGKDEEGAPNEPEAGQPSRLEAWEKLRGALKDVFAELGGGEAYLRKERESFELAERLREMHLWRSPVTKRDV